MSIQLFKYHQELADRTKQQVIRFGQTFPQFAFDQALLQPAADFVTRGKLFRGSVCLQASQALSMRKQPSSAAWSAACALELAGSALLIQDDITDESELRRGKLALYREFMSLWPGNKTDERAASHFAESAAMYVSDVLFYVASQVLMNADCSAEIKVALMQVMSREIATLALCQSEEMRLAAIPLSDITLSEETVIAILVGKSARYTAIWPLEFAGILAGVSESVIERLQRFGRAMGLVFQLSDDRLGLFGDPIETGKDVHGDAASGKKTLYACYALNTLTGVERNEFLSLYGTGEITPDRLLQLQKLLIRTGVAEAVDATTRRYVLHAKQELEPLLDTYPELVSLLTETVDFLLERKK